jgi:hypothetical protein
VNLPRDSELFKDEAGLFEDRDPRRLDPQHVQNPPRHQYVAGVQSGLHTNPALPPPATDPRGGIRAPRPNPFGGLISGMTGGISGGYGIATPGLSSIRQGVLGNSPRAYQFNGPGTYGGARPWP